MCQHLTYKLNYKAVANKHINAQLIRNSDQEPDNNNLEKRMTRESKMKRYLVEVSSHR